MAATWKSREIRLVSRPVGAPTLDDFTAVTTDVPPPAAGRVVVRNTWMSVDPYMRGRMDDTESYLPPFPLGGAPLDGAAVGVVVASAAPDVPVGATVWHFAGWREYALLDAAAVTAIDTAVAPAQAYLGVLGTPGLTAYAALTEVAPVRAGDTVFISAAAGAVGSVAGQLARRLGAVKVIGSAGGPAKVARAVAEFGYDTVLDHTAGPIAGQLRDRIDVYLDAVGGEHLEAAIGAARTGGRIALVGAISGYDTPVPGPRNLFQAAAKELTLRGRLVTSYLHLMPAWIPVGAGLRAAETVVEGIERAPDALLGVLRGANIGKMLVRL